MRTRPVVPSAIADDPAQAINRRQFLRLMGASLALGGLGACSLRPSEPVVPYVSPPSRLVPGQSLFFATAFAAGRYAQGVLVESQMGRPIKVEGNPRHPASLGATDAFAQASVLTLWDPERSRTVLRGGQESTWDEFTADLSQALDAQRATGGAGLRILTETVISPSLAGQIRAVLAQFPSARWHQFEPAGPDNARAGAQLAFGQYVDTQYRLDRAQAILSLDADFLMDGPAGVRYSRDFAVTRRAWATPQGQAGPAMSRLYVIESTPSITGAVADHRLAMRAGDIEAAARAVAGRLGVQAGGQAPPGATAAWIDAAAADLQSAGAAGLVMAGPAQPPAVHALAHAVNQALGSAGTTVLYSDPVEDNPVDQAGSLRSLVQEMAAGQVALLIVLGGNPAYTAPADLDFAGQLGGVERSVHLGLYRDETSERATWHIPEAHYLEAWGDARAYDGTATIIQPLIAPLHGAHTAYELLAALAGQAGQGSDVAYRAVRAHWQARVSGGDFDAFWQGALRDGVIPDSAAPVRQVVAQATLPAHAPAPAGGLEIVFRPDPNIWDGRFANNAWLQELPKPLTKVTWDNVAMMSPATAGRLGVRTGTRVSLRYEGRSVDAPVWVMAGHADESVTVFLGYGQRRAGGIGSELGYNAYALRTSGAPWIGYGLEVTRAGSRRRLAVTQQEHSMLDRDFVQAGTLQRYRENPQFRRDDYPDLEAEGDPEALPSLYPEWEYPGYRWAMAIDLSTCVGCQACVVACQAENNIPVVGRKEVLHNRWMYWLRIDSYVAGEGRPDGAAYFQPVPCMHCEKAPCEAVCPVHATVHSEDGLNDMVYNRCVGTRYCSNNCPYKVRRFNFLEYVNFKAGSLKSRWNPEVTTRSRGVMEKCTYCVQRIRTAQVEAEKAGRRIRDGEVMTACQQACPTGAIVFGDLNDPNSAVARMRAQPLSYALLGLLNTQPRTTYLAALRNPNPGLERG